MSCPRTKHRPFPHQCRAMRLSLLSNIRSRKKRTLFEEIVVFVSLAFFSNYLRIEIDIDVCNSTIDLRAKGNVFPMAVNFLLFLLVSFCFECCEHVYLVGHGNLLVTIKHSLKENQLVDEEFCLVFRRRERKNMASCIAFRCSSTSSTFCPSYSEDHSQQAVISH